MGARESLVILGIALLTACSGGAKPDAADHVPAGHEQSPGGDAADDKSGGEAKAGEAKAGQAKAGEAKAGEAKAGEAKAGEAKAGEKDDDRKGPADLVVLSADEVGKIGITTAAAQAVTYTPGAQGFGVVVSHDVIAQVAADLQTATAALRQSQAALERGKRLASGPGALGKDTVETAARQVGADQAALQLAQRKLTATLGQAFPRQRRAADGLLDDLAGGQTKLARITFPPGALGTLRPKNLRVSVLDAAPGVASWTTSELWEAPQDPTLPGRSFFALLSAPEIPEGARLQALAMSAEDGIAGVLIPTSGVVVSNGQSWCYVQKKEGTFARTPIDTTRPLADGYFNSSGVAPGDQIVTSAAGLLLARQLNASTEAPDD